ncbi:glycosyltransferase family 2 protein [Ornithinimicrobium cryptoxanthini]|uniref:glycosyltransferase family 2 protein n=1 Tax=Ornithinimicrobium cryptoxanthini TaxID=2934161 RepID=UPI0021185CDF|nr:galactosyltransferase-related protein [Ornithinimicrobium cryptoxanthini]
MTARTAVITVVHGRHEHLAGQLWGLRRQQHPPAVFVAVAMDDPRVSDVVREHADAGWDTRVTSVPSSTGGLPLAAARNAGARTALEAGAEVLVFLDVDCIPSPTLLGRYAGVLRPDGASRQETRSQTGSQTRSPVVAAGEVGYLPPVDHPRRYREPDLASLARPHPARPVLDPDEVRVAQDLRLFWSLSFALDHADWRLLGGFGEEYVGYGGEDTDFGQRIGAAGGELLWVGGATAYHQHHPSPDPPLHHLESIVRNANCFHDRWGWFPMEGWLERFAALGLAGLDKETQRWRVLTPAGRVTSD